MSPLPGLEDFSSCAFTHGWRRGLNDRARFAGFRYAEMWKIFRHALLPTAGAVG